MSSTLPPLADAQNKFEDLSGVDVTAYENPYDALIEACGNNPAQLQARYSTHRITRNGQQKEKLLSPDFSGLILDPILQRLMDPTIEPDFKDFRHCLVFWARPPSHIRSLAGKVQQKLLTLAPSLWLMPLSNMHLTALEITYSLTDAQIKAIVTSLTPAIIAEMTDYTLTHRARLIKPMLSYDGAALALSFLPAAGEGLSTTSESPSEEHGEKERTAQDDSFTYHHLRRNLFNLAKKSGVSVDSRYVVPSSHITLGRFLTQKDHDTPEKMEKWIALIQEVNIWLEEEFWPKEEKGDVKWKEAEWVVGQERGLDCREGTLWYGGGETVRIGKGF